MMEQVVAQAATSAAGADTGGGMTVTTMLVIALVGLLVVTFGGLALAIGLGLLTARRRNRSGGSDPGTRPDSTGTPFK